MTQFPDLGREGSASIFKLKVDLFIEGCAAGGYTCSDRRTDVMVLLEFCRRHTIVGFSLDLFLMIGIVTTISNEWPNNSIFIKWKMTNNHNVEA